MSSVDPAHDPFFDYDEVDAYFERLGRPALPNEY